MSSREIIEALKKAGWFLHSTQGDHHHFKHPTLPGKVTVAHPQKDVTIAVIRSIEKQSGMKIR
ncbi:MAG: type II toxin-antitoxin system HicA family toxin [Magnetococcales bacterium]|nr:type II toxin-antitoxin system HicA family toxin [Magnetococcales bacterium]MBF0584869.1 type II toxin-antitoxin system HicA family toxin [Magnetococcales bacterium]